MSLTDELQKRSNNRKKILPYCIVLLIAFLWYAYRSDVLWLFNASESNDQTTGTGTVYTVKRSDITIWLVSDGQVKWDNVLTLGFELNGKIKSILKRIGEKVVQWELLASIDQTAALTDLRRAQNALQQSILSYNTKVKPLSALELEQIYGSLQINTLNVKSKELSVQQDILSNQKSLEDMQSKLTILEEDLRDLDGDTSLGEKLDEQNQAAAQKQKDLLIQIGDLNQKVIVNLADIDEFLWVSSRNANKNDEFEFLIWAEDLYSLPRARTLRNDLNNAFIALPADLNISGEQFLVVLDQAAEVAKKMYELWTVMQEVMNNTIEGPGLSSSQIQTYKSNFSSLYSSAYAKYQTFISGKESYKALLLSSRSSLGDTEESVDDKKKSLQQQIDQLKKDMLYNQNQIAIKNQTIQHSVDINDQQSKNDAIDYQLKVNPLSADEKNSYALQIESARITVAEKQLAVSKASLKSPVDGVVLTIVWHPGETAWSNFMTIATKWYTYVDVSLDEEDINNVFEGQIVTITSDSISDLEFTWEVYYIAWVGNTDNNGLVTYPVYIRYNNPDERIKTSMKVSIAFIQKQIKDVLVVPVKAVFAYQNKPHVTMEDGTLRPVVTGMSDGKQTEIISWLQNGERVLVKK